MNSYFFPAAKTKGVHCFADGNEGNNFPLVKASSNGELSPEPIFCISADAAENSGDTGVPAPRRPPTLSESPFTESVRLWTVPSKEEEISD